MLIHYIEYIKREVVSSAEESFIPRTGDFIRLESGQEEYPKLYEVRHVELVHVKNQGISHAEILVENLT